MNVSSWRNSTLSSARHRQYGLVALVGGLLNLVIAFTGPTANTNEGTTIFWVGMFAQALATGLMLVGLYGLHHRYREQYGRIGLVLAGLFGVALAWLTVAMAIPGTATLLGVGDTVLAIEGSWFFVNLMTMPIASLYGIVLWRGGVLGAGTIVMTMTGPLGIAIILILGATVGNIGLAFWVPLGLAWTVVGYEMLRDADTGLRLNRH